MVPCPGPVPAPGAGLVVLLEGAVHIDSTDFLAIARDRQGDQESKTGYKYLFHKQISRQGMVAVGRRLDRIRFRFVQN